jgi:hypothetical protein
VTVVPLMLPIPTRASISCAGSPATRLRCRMPS